jgi:hypothetical protein
VKGGAEKGMEVKIEENLESKMIKSRYPVGKYGGGGDNTKRSCEVSLSAWLRGENIPCVGRERKAMRNLVIGP